MNRVELAKLILRRLEQTASNSKKNWQESKNQIGYFVIDELLPLDVVDKINEVFPKPREMKRLKSIREDKFVSAQMDQHHPLLEEIIYAFQEPSIVKAVKDICQLNSLYPDPMLYAGGLSLMEDSQFLNPHLDNSHNNGRKKWRVLNLLYYVSPNWEPSFGGKLELWSDGLKSTSIQIACKYNRLVIMATHDKSWHSVEKIKGNFKRQCVSNYFFSDSPVKKEDKFHVTSFRGRSNQKIIDLVLQLDSGSRMLLRKLFPKGVVKTKHLYKKP